MKTSKAILLTIILFLFLASACSAPAYLGKSYPPTEDVDVYMDAADIKKQYTTMGSSDVDQNFSSVEVMQQKMVDMGKAKGADGVILKLVEEVAAVSQSGVGTVNRKTKNNIRTSSSTTTNIKEKKIHATFIKYN